ncbi:MAG: tetratricopeptide repeat protein [Thermoguttaceae bacterium]
MLAIGLGALWPAAARAQTTTGPAQPSFFDSISASVSQTAAKIGAAFKPKPTPPDDPVSLKTKAKPGVELYVAMARLYEQSGKFADAEDQYKQAFHIAPNDLRALLGYAQLKDAMNEPQEALKYYQKASKAHPDVPSVYNNLAVHYARQAMSREAIGALDRAIQLQPNEPRYRNNMATLLVQAGRPREAFNQLRAIHDEAVAHYDLGFLLSKVGQRQAAAREFVTALQINPSFVPARQWLDRLAVMAVRDLPPVQPTPQPGLPPMIQADPPVAVAPPPAALAPPLAIRQPERMAANPGPPVPPGSLAAPAPAVSLVAPGLVAPPQGTLPDPGLRPLPPPTQVTSPPPDPGPAEPAPRNVLRSAPDGPPPTRLPPADQVAPLPPVLN